MFREFNSFLPPSVRLSNLSNQLSEIYLKHIHWYYNMFGEACVEIFFTVLTQFQCPHIMIICCILQKSHIIYTKRTHLEKLNISALNKINLILKYNKIHTTRHIQTTYCTAPSPAQLGKSISLRLSWASNISWKSGRWSTVASKIFTCRSNDDKNCSRSSFVVSNTRERRHYKEMKWHCFMPPLCTLFRLNWVKQAQGNEVMKHAPPPPPRVGSNQQPSNQKSRTLPLDYWH